ncbi:heparin lyase I family protein [Bradyrhizobium sp. ORS 111]|uniref:heparin lyase I family protein n=1 Tax=Bradyrhizobium sp. ORS 111 TaxID=1685958 RepID=UPI00389008A4
MQNAQKTFSAAAVSIVAVLSLTCISLAQDPQRAGWRPIAGSKAPISIRGITYVPESAMSEWSIGRSTASATDITRFEVRAGDEWAEDRESGENKERSELDGYKRRFPHGADVWGAYALFIEPGADYQSDWTAISQMHGSKVRPFHIHFKLGRLVIFTEATSPRPATNVRYSGPLSRNQWHNLVFHLREGEADSGQLDVWLDGNKIVQFVGAIGATGNEAYWKFGIYRGYGPIATPFAIQFANMEIGTTDLTSRITSPLPVK